jgi:hypothetical protein
MNEALTAKQYQELARAEKHGRIPRASKIRRTVGNITFHSLAEANRYKVLKMAEIAGRISRLTIQPKYPLLVNGHLIGHYIGDFEYLNETGQVVLEDVKSKHTAKDPVYRLKKKMLFACYGMEIKEVM